MKQKTARESTSNEPGCRVSHIPFSEVPHQSRLFLQYLTEPLSLKKFYPNVKVSPSDISEYIPTVLEKFHADRDRLCDVLLEINGAVGVGKETLANIEELRHPDTVTIITGQQAGLFTGPLYTIYKALSAVKLAAELRAKGHRAVPVFWAATEDHDFDEVSEAFVIDKIGKLVRSKYEPTERLDGTAVGAAVIDNGITEVIEVLFDNLSETSFSNELHDQIRTIWANGNGFGLAFEKTLSWMLEKYGVIYVDPMHPEIKRLAEPIFSAAVENVDEIVSKVLARGSELESDGFHTQVLVEDDYFPLFWHDDDGRRLALRKTGDEVFKTKDGERKFSKAELIEIAVTEPQRFSPGVMLRPIVQDFLFPTACYFGGGAEIAYFAQNSEVYRILDRPVTPVFHRQSFTIIESKQQRILDKFQIELEDLFAGKEEMTLGIGGGIIAHDTARLFAEVEERINTEMNRLDQAVSNIETTLAKNVARRRQRIVYHIAALRKKSLLAKVRNDEIANRQIDELFSTLLPNGGLQERTINALSYLNKYGLKFIDWIYEAIDLKDKEHRIVEL